MSSGRTGSCPEHSNTTVLGAQNLSRLQPAFYITADEAAALERASCSRLSKTAVCSWNIRAVQAESNVAVLTLLL